MAPAEFFGQYPAADSPDTRTDGNTEREYHHSDNPLRRLEIVSQYRMGRGRTAGFADANADAREQQLPEILCHPAKGGEKRPDRDCPHDHIARSEEHTSELQSLMRISYAVFCLTKKNKKKK